MEFKRDFPAPEGKEILGLTLFIQNTCPQGPLLRHVDAEGIKSIGTSLYLISILLRVVKSLLTSETM